MKLLAGRRAQVIALALAGGALALPASAAALTPALPRITLEAGPVVTDVSGFIGDWPDDPANPSGPLVWAGAFPFAALLHFSQPPASVSATLRDPSFAPLAIASTPTAVQVDADTWTLTLPVAAPAGTKVALSTNYVPARFGFSGNLTTVFRLATPALAPPAPAADPAPVVELLGVARRGATVVVRLSTNVAGSVDGGVRQAGRARRLTSTKVTAGRHRFVLAVPRPRTRAATVTLKLTDASGGSVRVTRTLR